MPKGANYSAMEAGFAKGEIAMMINGPWAWDNAKKAGINFGVATIPAVGKKPGRPFVGVLGCMITQPSPNKDIAKEFLENSVLSLDGLKTINADVPLGTPANKAFFKELSANPVKGPHQGHHGERASSASPCPTSPRWGSSGPRWPRPWRTSPTVARRRRRRSTAPRPA